RPRANQLVLLLDPSEAGTGAVPRTATTDAEGRFRFSALHPGAPWVSLVAQRSFQQVKEMSARVTVAAGATTALTLQAKGDARTRGGIEGDLAAIDFISVNLHRRGPADESREAAAPPDGTVADRGTFAEGGRFEIGALLEGRYSIAVNG